MTVLQIKSVAPITRQMQQMRAHVTLIFEMEAVIITFKEKIQIEL